MKTIARILYRPQLRTDFETGVWVSAAYAKMWLFIRDFTFPKIIFLAIYFLSGCSTKQGRLIKEKGFLKPAVKMKSGRIVFHYHCKPQIWVLSPTLIKTAEKKHLIPEKK